jgi:NitT/TauT family transport system ATP-binding protein
VRAIAEALISLRQVAKRYTARGGTHDALAGIDLDVRQGEFVCLLGASGCGKSTLLNIIAGFETASDGTVEMRGQPIRSSGADRMLFFQDAGAALFPWMTAAGNVRFGLKLQRVPKAEQDRRIRHYLSMVGLWEHADKMPAQLSGGMKQRLQIARALAVEPDVLLMDEPFAALDPRTRRHMHAELLRIWADTGKTIVFVTHDINEAVVLADRIVLLTVGPGSRISETFGIDLPRPRLASDPQVQALLRDIEAAFDDPGADDAEAA